MIGVIIMGAILGIIAWTIVKSDKEGSRSTGGGKTNPEEKEDDNEKLIGED